VPCGWSPEAAERQRTAGMGGFRAIALHQQGTVVIAYAGARDQTSARNRLHQLQISASCQRAAGNALGHALLKPPQPIGSSVREHILAIARSRYKLRPRVRS